MGAQEIEAFLTYPAKERNVFSSTQNQALNALLFLYRNVLHIDLPIPLHALRAKRSEHLPTVLSKDEVMRVIAGMQGLHQLRLPVNILAQIKNLVGNTYFRLIAFQPILAAGSSAAII